MKKKKLQENKKINMKIGKKPYMIIFCLIISLCTLMICSQNSPLYAINDWVDANAFMTVGKGMAHGLIPYKNLFEQKGPLLYFIYMIGYLISNHSFLGIFIIEVVFGTIFLYYGHKIIELFTDKKYSYIILPILFTMICTSQAFCHGGSAEELCLPFFMYSLYHLLNYYKNEKINNKIIFLNGLTAGFIFMIKYTLVGFWFGFMMFIFFDQIYKKNIKDSFKYCVIFLIGMSIPFALFSIYFIINGALNDFINTYFLFNIKYYSGTKTTILQKISNSFTNSASNFLESGVLLLVLFIFAIAIVLFTDDFMIKARYKIFLTITIIITIIMCYIGENYYYYYNLILLPFIIITIIEIFIKIDPYLKKLKSFKYNYYFPIFTIVICTILSFKLANYNFYLFIPKADFVQYEFANIINKDKDKSLLNYNFLDLGLYFLTDQDPKLKYFELQNIKYNVYPKNKDEQVKCIEKKCVNYIVVVSHLEKDYLKEIHTQLFENYKLIKSKQSFQDVALANYYLFKKK